MCHRGTNAIVDLSSVKGLCVRCGWCVTALLMLCEGCIAVFAFSHIVSGAIMLVSSLCSNVQCLEEWCPLWTWNVDMQPEARHCKSLLTMLTSDSIRLFGSLPLGGAESPLIWRAMR